jgi:hypothetical protein
MREEAIIKVRGRVNRSARSDSSMTDEEVVGKSFCNRPDGWVINRKTMKIILLGIQKKKNTLPKF